MKKISFFIITLILSISSCIEDDCGFRFCPTPDFDSINALYLEFDEEIFSVDEIAQAFIVQYTKENDFNQALDTFYFTEQFAQGNYTMILSDPEPFSSGGTVNINAYENYDYIIFPNSTHIGYQLSKIEVKGEYQDCNCAYVNTQKTFKLNDVAMDKTGSVIPVVLD